MRRIAWRSLLIYLIIAAVFIILPVFLPSFALYLLNEILIYGLFSYGFYLLFSHAGYLSFGHAAYFALGAYSVALAYKYFATAVWLPFLSAVIVTVVISTILGYLSVRLGKLYFAFLTLAFAQMIYTILFRWRSLTGGDDGLPGVSRGVLDFVFIKINLDSAVNFYYFSLIIFLILVFILHRLILSSFGLSLRSIRDNLERTSFVGLNPHLSVLVAFVISAVYAAVAGGLHASLTKMAYPELSYWSTSAEPIFMTLIGGLYTFTGPFIGTAIFILVKTYLMTILGNWVLFLGIILLLMVLFFRSGVMGFLQQKSGLKL